jgi:FemAB-related protein (PEP-CTERM system-associated)
MSAMRSVLGPSGTGRAIRVAPFSGAPHEWDGFVAAQPGATHYHRYGWRAVMRRAFGHDSVLLAAHDDTGRLCGVLPLVRVKSVLFGHHLVSMPFLNYGGPLGDTDAVRALVGEASRLARTQRVKQLELRSRIELPLDLECSREKVTMVLDLAPGDSHATWQSLPSTIRNGIRKPLKRGVSMRFGRDQLNPFFQVFSHNMRDLGTPAHPRALFEAIADEFPDDVWYGCAYVDGAPAAAACGIVYGDEIELSWGSALRAYNSSHAPNMLLYWSFMERAAQQGLARFNFGRCTPGSGTHHFKKQWRAREEQLWWYGQSRHGLAPGGVQRDSALALGPRLWRRLPLSVATGVGPYIRRGIPA